MTVLQEVLEWSAGRPAWQRDALRRLVMRGDLADEDIVELAEICKSEHGLAEHVAVNPLAAQHIPDATPGDAAVELASIFHHRGVNALAEGQALTFAPGLNVVYGDNGAGKTGYIRILKRACRSRRQERILGNVASGSTPLSPVVSIKYRVGSEPTEHEWTTEGVDESISRVSVFDSQSAAVYLTERTDVAFRPFGLDLFDKLVRACKAVRARLEADQQTLGGSRTAAIQGGIPEGTAVAKFVAGVSSLTNPDAARSLATLTAEEEVELARLEASLRDLKAVDQLKLIQTLTTRLKRAEQLAAHVRVVETTLSDEAVNAILAASAAVREGTHAAQKLRESALSVGMLAGTGSDLWSMMWEAARTFSNQAAYMGDAFPRVGEGARCVLCQQDLDATATHRLTQFEALVTSTAERDLRDSREDLARRLESFGDLQIKSELTTVALAELRIEHEAGANAISAGLDTAEQRRSAVLAALEENGALAPSCPSNTDLQGVAAAISKHLSARIDVIRASNDRQATSELEQQARELQARQQLAKVLNLVLEEIERKKKYAAYALCIDQTRTQAITGKSTAITRTTVTERLKDCFRREMGLLSFAHVDVELTEAGGTEGLLYHRLTLTRAPGVELPSVASEGEQRCLAIAAFLAELSTADQKSSIVLDDPVSSLDFQWREGIARRLVQESRERQVIVFTHDVVFLLLLGQIAEELGVSKADQYVRHLASGSGVCTPELPWVAMPVNRKIGHLKMVYQAASKLFREGHQDAYEKEAKYLYGLLREAWERAVEEVLLDSVVERYRPSVQTRRVSRLADITAEDCNLVESAMTKCSAWLHGHDQAAAARAPVPGPTELGTDIGHLEKWAATVRGRRR